MAKTRKRNRAKDRVTLAQGNWDHGPSTQAAKAGTIVEEVKKPGDANPNGVTRRRKRLQSNVWADKLSMRQHQAAVAIETAYARVEALGSGGDSIGRMIDLRTQVDASPKPDATIDVQAGVQSHLVYVMRSVPQSMRPVIEHMFWHQRPMRTFAQGKLFYNRSSDIKVALDLVANHMRY